MAKKQVLGLILAHLAQIWAENLVGPNLSKLEKSQKTLLLGPIWTQSLDIMVSYHHVQYQKKLMTQSWDNFVTERRTEGRTDGREWFYRMMSTNVECTAKNVHITFKVRGIAAINNRCMKYDNFIKIIKIFQRSFS